MLEVISQKEEIAKYQEIFYALLSKKLPQKVELVFGYQGESFRTEAITDGKFWHTSDINKNNRWNLFGFDPNPTGSNSIWVQVSLYQVGINRRVGGCLGLDRDTGSVCLLHRGNLAGGRPGIGKRAYMDWLQHNASERFRMVQDGDRRTQMIWVADLDEARLLPDLQNFVKLAWRFKEQAVEKEK